MKASDLRIGNLVEYNGITFQVYSIQSPEPMQDERFSDKYLVTLSGDGLITVTIDEIKPITLTEEWLAKFSEFDVRNAYHKGYFLDKISDTQFIDKVNDFIQSLQQTEWDVELEMEFVGRGKHGIGSEVNHYMPKRDVEGCLILKRI